MNTHILTHPILNNKLLSLKFPRLSLKIFGILSFILILFLSIFYVFQINQITTGSYLIKNYEQRIEDFFTENLRLEINLAQINSLKNIEEKARELDFEKVKQVKYIQILDSSLAGVHEQNWQKLAD